MSEHQATLAFFKKRARQYHDADQKGMRIWGDHVGADIDAICGHLEAAIGRAEDAEALNADLLEALKRMVTDFGDSAGDDMEARQVISDARAAIARATTAPETDT